MPYYGILKDGITDPNALTGSDSELAAIFTAPLSIESRKPTYMNETVNLKRRFLDTQIQRWEITAGIKPEEVPFEAMVHNVLMGYTNNFYIRMPQLYRRNNPIPENIDIELYGTAAQGADFVALKGVVFANRLMNVGEFIRFGNHSKVYLVTSSLYVYGVSVVKIFPKLLIETPVDTAVFYGKRVAMRAVYDQDTKLGISYTDGILAETMTVKLIESL